MNKKGFYGALIGLMALILVASFVYLNQGIQQTQRTGIERENILEVSKQWQRVNFLLDKATADALGDAAFIGGCSLESATNQSLKDNNVSPYFDTVLNTSGFNCTYSNLLVSKETIDPTTWDANVSIDLNCFQSSNELMVWMSSNTIFEKRIEAIYDAGPPQSCRVTVKDRQANDSVEIDVNESM
jgi:hypothetical protein